MIIHFHPHYTVEFDEESRTPACWINSVLGEVSTQHSVYSSPLLLGNCWADIFRDLEVPKGPFCIQGFSVWIHVIHRHIYYGMKGKFSIVKWKA